MDRVESNRFEMIWVAKTMCKRTLNSWKVDKDEHFLLWLVIDFDFDSFGSARPRSFAHSLHSPEIVDSAVVEVKDRWILVQVLDITREKEREREREIRHDLSETCGNNIQ